jgi:DNA-binding SARP family transcriptional activator/TolB-like protein
MTQLAANETTSAASVSRAFGEVRPRLLISVLGGIGLQYSGREILLPNRKARAMIAYLALNGSGEELRERLVGLFWSESPESNAREVLRRAIFEVRRAMDQAGCDAFVPARLTVGLKLGSFSVDLNEIVADLARRETPDALLREPRVTETFLAGYDDLDPSFRIWVLARRQTWHDRLVRALEDAYRNQAAPYRQRRRLGEAMLLLDPTHEEACRVVMRCAAEEGETGAALRAYEGLYRLLDEEYGQEPSAQTQALVVDIKQGKLGPLTSDAEAWEAGQMPPMQNADEGVKGAEAPPPAKAAVMIPTFSMNGIDPDRVHVVEGFRIDLIACLVRFRGWFIAETASAYEARNDPALPRVAAWYQVNTNAYQAGSTINTVMVLTDKVGGIAIWSERFELRLDNWFETQQRLVRRIATTLDVQISAERLARLSGVPDDLLETYDIWLRAQSLAYTWTSESWERALPMLTQAIDRAPGFSPLYYTVAVIKRSVHFNNPGLMVDPEIQDDALAFAQKAVQLDPRDSRAELGLAWSLAMKKNFHQASVHMDIAEELNPYDSWTLMSAALFHAFVGDHARARATAARSLEMTVSPTRIVWSYYASITYLDGDDETAVKAAERAQMLTSQLYAWRGAALWNLGRHAEAKADGERFLSLARQNWHGGEPASDAMIGRWLLQCWPIGNRDSWQRLARGASKIGIPSAGITHLGW